MILYHGSNRTVQKIDFAKCRPFRDFGTGFYLTTYEDQAQRMASRVVRIFGGEAVVSIFKYNKDALAGLNVLVFDKPSTEWAHFVMNNRSRTFNDLASPECNLDNKYDIVIGPVANDDMALLFRQFSEGLIPLDSLARGLEYRDLSNQYSFHTKKAISLLT